MVIIFVQYIQATIQKDAICQFVYIFYRKQTELKLNSFLGAFEYIMAEHIDKWDI